MLRRRVDRFPLDIQGTAFQRRVWAALQAIPPGVTASYSEIARRIGRPKAARAVASACAANSIAVAIPCHRALRADGGLGGYRWGLERKQALLEAEVEEAGLIKSAGRILANPAEALLEFQFDGYCGLYCGACPVLLETKAGTGRMVCFGCKSGQPAGHCQTCEIKACAREKGFSFCGECPDLIPCEKMNGFLADAEWPYHAAVPANFRAIRAMGVPQWLQAQETRWKCAACGATHAWRDEICPRCGAAVASYKADLV